MPALFTVAATVGLSAVATADPPPPPEPIFLGSSIPWNVIGEDIGGAVFNTDWFETYFAGAAKNGSNTARFVLHGDGHAGITYDTVTGETTGLTATFIPQLQQLASLAAKHQLVLQIVLWTSAMCDKAANGASSRSDIASNLNKTNAYVTNALRPIVFGLVGSNNVLFEAFDAPEKCMKETPCSTDDCVSNLEMQRLVALMSRTIHEGAKKVTVGALSLRTNSVREAGNWWSDQALTAATKEHGGCAAPTIDIYNIHFTDADLKAGLDPMRYSTAYFLIEGKIAVIGEEPSTSQNYTATELLGKAHANGYHGNLFYAYNAGPRDGLAPGTLEAMAAFGKSVGALATYEAITEWMGWLSDDALACHLKAHASA